jgi:hypothetical protein
MTWHFSKWCSSYIYVQYILAAFRLVSSLLPTNYDINTVWCQLTRATEFVTMRPKARGLAQHGGPPGWLEVSGPAGVILSVMD